MRNTQTFYAAWASETPGFITLVIFDRRFINSEKPLTDQLQNALFYDDLPSTFALQIGSHLCNVVAEVAQTQVQSMRKAFYDRVAAEHVLDPADPEQLGRLNAILTGMGSHDLDPTYPKPEARHE